MKVTLEELDWLLNTKSRLDHLDRNYKYNIELMQEYEQRLEKFKWSLNLTSEVRNKSLMYTGDNYSD